MTKSSSASTRQSGLIRLAKPRSIPRLTQLIGSGIAILGALLSATIAGASLAQVNSQSEQQELRIVEVSSPQINCVFDRDCRITVTDFSEQFFLPFAQGKGFIQSRQFPIGEPTTIAAGLHSYLYRVDLSQMRNATAKRCVKTVSFDFSTPVALAYSNRRGDGLAHVFVVTKNALGTAKPIRAMTNGQSIDFQFRDLCTAGPNDNQGSDSFFFGMASKSRPATVRARLTDQDGRAIEALAKAATPSKPGGPTYARPNVTADSARITPPPRIITPGGVPVTTPLPKTYEGQSDQAAANITPQAESPTALVSNDEVDVVIGFEEYRANRNGITIENQYREEFGVRFLPGVTVHQCGGESTRAMACTYVRAGDGTRTAYFDGQSNGGVMIIDFARPVKEVTMRVNPTGAKQEETFSLEMGAFQGGRDLVASSRENILWTFDEATNWPFKARILVDNPKGATRLAVVMRAQKQNNQVIRFLFDEIKITYAKAGSTNDGNSPNLR